MRESTGPLPHGIECAMPLAFQRVLRAKYGTNIRTRLPKHGYSLRVAVGRRNGDCRFAVTKLPAFAHGRNVTVVLLCALLFLPPGHSGRSQANELPRLALSVRLAPLKGKAVAWHGVADYWRVC